MRLENSFLFVRFISNFIELQPEDMGGEMFLSFLIE